jgi:perosamine synthetase
MSAAPVHAAAPELPAIRIPLAVPQLGHAERDAVAACVESGWVAGAGPIVARFEAAVAARAGQPHAVAMASGTAALHVALRALRIGRGDAVLVPAITFIAPANAVCYAGAAPIFADVDPVTWQLEPRELERCLRERCTRTREGFVLRDDGARLRALIAVHVLGHPAPLRELRALAREHGLALLEDAAEALGARCDGEPVGSAGEIACFSFNANKTVTAGGGGMLVTGDAALAARARYLAAQAKDDPVEYVHREIGFNYALSSLQAAVGSAQLERLDHFVARKREIAARYAEAFAGVPGLSSPAEAPWALSSCWLSALRIDAARFGCDRVELARRLRARGIETRPLWQALHESPAHAGARTASAAGCPVAAELQREVLCLPCSTGLTEGDQREVIDAILACSRASSHSASSRSKGVSTSTERSRGITSAKVRSV